MKKFMISAIAASVALAACTTQDTHASKNEQESHAVKESHDSHSAPANSAQNTCVNAGPQTPRDIASTAGTNMADFTMAPDASAMNLCNIHTHTQAEHKAPGFSIFAGEGAHGGFQCNGTESLSAAELVDPANGHGAYKGVKPGDTIEVHWVHSSCDISPGEGLGSCLNDACTDPILRVEAQAFLLVNDPNAADFNDFTVNGEKRGGLYQAKSLPATSGTPVVFRGSTTGTSYNNQTCSPLEVTWSVRPNCTKLDISSLYRWAEEGNVFNETKSHGVRPLVTDKALLAPIK